MAKLEAFVRKDERLLALWLQGSLARGDDDALSDIDAYIAVKDEVFDEVFAERLPIAEAIAPVLAWSNANHPALKTIHALLEGPVKLDLFFERASAVPASKRPCARVLLDKTGICAALDLSWTPPAAQAAAMTETMVRVIRQGALWPLRLLLRGQWSTFVMMEIDLINRETALMMALERDPQAHFINQFTMSRHLSAAQQAELDALTAEALRVFAEPEAMAVLDLHLRIQDTLMRAQRAACAALSVPYPIPDGADEKLRELLIREWPKTLPAGRPG